MSDDKAAGEPLPPAGAADERFAASFGRYLAASGMSQGELARRMSAAGWKWHQQTVARVLDGSRKLGVGEAHAVARALGTTVDRMLMPGPEAEAAGELEPATADANRAWERILHSARDLAVAQARLRGAVARAEAAGYHGSETVRRLAGNARRAITLDPRDAAGAGHGSTEE
jgi:transcriptional regulator with XRE-family HTH domain